MKLSKAELELYNGIPLAQDITTSTDHGMFIAGDTDGGLQQARTLKSLIAKGAVFRIAAPTSRIELQKRSELLAKREAKLSGLDEASAASQRKQWAWMDYLESHYTIGGKVREIKPVWYRKRIIELEAVES